MKPASGNCFYTAGAVLSGKILPPDCRLPNWKDWNRLNDYLNGEASALKSGTWNPLKDGEMVMPATNLSGFNGMPVGLYIQAHHELYVHKFSIYWTLDNSNTAMAEKSFALNSGADSTATCTPDVDKYAMSIRCIKK